VNGAIDSQCTFTLFGFFGQDVTLERLLVSDLTGARYLKTLLGTGVCFYLWHFLMLFQFYPCGVPHRRTLMEPLQAISRLKRVAKVMIFAILQLSSPSFFMNKLLKKAVLSYKLRVSSSSSSQKRAILIKLKRENLVVFEKAKGTLRHICSIFPPYLRLIYASSYREGTNMEKMRKDSGIECCKTYLKKPLKTLSFPVLSPMTTSSSITTALNGEDGHKKKTSRFRLIFH
jgi:hypothetical protein